MNRTPEQHDRLMTHLTNLYEVNLYRHNGIAYPLIFHPLSNAPVQQEIDTLLGRMPAETIDRDSLTIYDYGYLHTLQNSQARLFNGTTFVLRQLRLNPLRIEANIGRYYDMIATCIALEREILAATQSKRIRLPLRSQYHQLISPKQSLTHGRGRSAGIGVAVLIVYNDRGEYKAILSRRTAAHATRARNYHVIPAFMFQPNTRQVTTPEWSIKHHIYREILEELFGVEEQTQSDIYQHPALVDLLTMIVNEQAHIYPTGIAVNLLTLRPEICALLLIDDPLWWQRIHDANAPYQLNAQSEAEGSLLTASILNDHALRAALPDHFETTMVPHGLVAFWEGVQLARSKRGFS